MKYESRCFHVLLRPHALHAVGIERRVAADDGQIFGKCLSNDDAVKWVAVVIGQGSKCRDMRQCDGQQRNNASSSMGSVRNKLI